MKPREVVERVLFKIIKKSQTKPLTIFLISSDFLLLLLTINLTTIADELIQSVVQQILNIVFF